MKKIILLILFTVSLNSFSQGLSFDWAKAFGHNDTKWSTGFAVGVDDEGSVYSTGSIYGTVDFDPGAGVFTLTSTTPSMYVSKLDKLGNFIWAKFFNLGVNTNGYKIAIDKWGYVYVVALVQKGGLSTVILVKLNKTGSLLWTKEFKPPHDTIEGYSTCNSLKTDSLGNIYAAGNFKGTIDFDPGPGTVNLSTRSVQEYDMYVSKLDSAGNYIFVKQIGGDKNDEATELELDSRNIYLTGNFGGTADFDPGTGIYNLTAKLNDVFISKLSLSGDFVWAKSLVGGNKANVTRGMTISVDAASNVYTAGFTSNTEVDFDPGPGTHNVNIMSTYSYAFLLKLTNAGEFSWVKLFMSDKPSLDVYRLIVRNGKDGSIYMAGGRSGDGLDLDPGSGIFKMTNSANFLLKLDAAGNFVTAKALTTEAPSAHMQGMDMDASQTVYTTGHFQYKLDLDPGPDTNYVKALGTGFNAFLQKLKPCKATASTLTLQKCFSYTLNGETYTKSGIYRQILSNAIGCDSVLTINLTVVDASPPICLVTVDNKSTHNIVVWDKPITTQIDSFRILRETTTNMYSHIASVAYDSLSEYHDYGANPYTSSYRYKLQTFSTTCGGDMSDYHSTIYLENFKGDFQWTKYTIEKKSDPVATYRMYRDDNNTGNFRLISTIPSIFSTFTDVNYNSYPNANYYLDVKWDIKCGPTQAVTTSRSNAIRKIITDVASQDQGAGFDIYPNPASETVVVMLTQIYGSTNLKIINILGEIVWNEEMTGASQSISLNKFTKGVYNIQLEWEGKRMNKKLVIN